jgi:hypothetical protein
MRGLRMKRRLVACRRRVPHSPASLMPGSRVSVSYRNREILRAMPACQTEGQRHRIAGGDGRCGPPKVLKTRSRLMSWNRLLR